MHAPASGVGTVSYKVPPAYNIFISLIGLARQDKSPNCNGTARFRIYINKELVHESGILRFGETQGIRIPVQAGDILTLEVDNGGDTYTCDHSTWAGARFEP
jgi:hypothetical protein